MVSAAAKSTVEQIGGYGMKISKVCKYPSARQLRATEKNAQDSPGSLSICYNVIRKRVALTNDQYGQVSLNLWRSPFELCVEV